MRFVIYKKSDYYQPFYWVVKAANGQVLATSEMYVNKQDCLSAIRSIMVNAASADVIDIA